MAISIVLTVLNSWQNVSSYFNCESFLKIPSHVEEDNLIFKKQGIFFHNYNILKFY